MRTLVITVINVKAHYIENLVGPTPLLLLSLVSICIIIMHDEALHYTDCMQYGVTR